jgi:hypothetical protein
MNNDKSPVDRLRDELLHLLSLSGTLAGLCITAVTLFHTLQKNSIATTVADDLLAVAALLFLVCTYLIFFSLKTRSESRSVSLARIVDICFLIALTSMVISGFIMVYTIW